MLKHSENVPRLLQNNCEFVLRHLNRDPDSDYFGLSNFVYAFGQFTPESIVATAKEVLFAYYCKGTKFYMNSEILKTVLEMVRFFDKRYVHDDGSIDLQSTNIHCPNTTGFCVSDTLSKMAYVVRELSSHTQIEDEVYEQLLSTLRKNNEALKHLGFHTPNHRWAITSALCACYNLLGDEESLEVMNKFLSEGIDCSEEGEWTERSTGCYNLICDRQYLHLYFQTKDRKFLDPVVRNLKLMFSLTESDDSVCTMSSTRIDNGTKIDILYYYYLFYGAAIFSRDSELAWYADYLLTKIEALEKLKMPVVTDRSPLEFWYLMMPDLGEIEESIVTVKPDLHKSVFLSTGMARHYYDNRYNDCLTVLTTWHQDFLKFHFSDNLEVRCRFAAAFFGDEHSIFRPGKLEKNKDGSYVLTSQDRAGYKSTFDTPPETSNWWKMDHSKRKEINVRELNRSVVVTPVKNGFTIDCTAEGDDDIPLKFEFVLNPGGLYENDSSMLYADKGIYTIQLNGTGRITCPGRPEILIKGSGIKDSYGRDMRGSGQYDSESFTVCFFGRSNHSYHYEFTYVPFFE